MVALDYYTYGNGTIGPQGSETQVFIVAMDSSTPPLWNQTGIEFHYASDAASRVAPIAAAALAGALALAILACSSLL
ncbi:hypothetical protein JCM24511_07188 [Saitozyma sp. JCM 24511]|nr:hypothetical protein JCM24511_07188 [Saitozyma sp. JCM 24511]